MTRASWFVIVPIGLFWSSLERPRQELAGIELRLMEVADSQSYFVYSYDVINPAQSMWAIGSLEVGISASSGTPDNLAVTGALFELTGIPGLPPEEPHAEVGPITPSGWEAALPGTAVLSWYPVGGSRLFTPDSVAPADTLGGFGIRSSYLPGISSVVGTPTVQSCCIVPDTVDDVLPGLAQFRVSASTVAPRYMPDEVTIDLLRSQLTAVCTDPLWLDDTALCTEFDGLLGMAGSDEDDDNFYGAAAVLDRLRARVVEEQSEMHPNAYWLLRRNAEQAHANALEAATAAADLWHLRNVPDTAVIAGAFALSTSTQQTGAVENTVPASSSEWVHFVKPCGELGSLSRRAVVPTARSHRDVGQRGRPLAA